MMWYLKVYVKIKKLFSEHTYLHRNCDRHVKGVLEAEKVKIHAHVCQVHSLQKDNRLEDEL